MEREELLLLAADQFEAAKKIERRIKHWQNDAERDSALNKSTRLLFEAMWNLTAANYRR